MARGGKGGNRGGSRGRGAAGFPANAQGTRTSQAQSGGDTTLIKGGLKGAGRLNLPGGADYKGTSGPTNQSIVKPHELAPKGFGGGY